MSASAPSRPLDPSELAAEQSERRSRILAAALALLETAEYDHIQMREVARSASVSLATVYRFFASKDHLYAAALLESSSGFDLNDEALIPGDTDEERLRALLMRAVRAFERRPQLLRAEISLESSSDVHVQQLFDQFADRHLAVMHHALVHVAVADRPVVVRTLVSVLSTRTRAWAYGRCTIDDVIESIDRSIELVFRSLGRS